jgi:hypothetical protein
MAVTIINNKLGSYAPVGYAGWIGEGNIAVNSPAGKYSDEDIAIASGVANYPQNRTDFHLARLSELGIIEWKKLFSIIPVGATFGAAWVDSSGNLYIVGSQSAAGLSGSEAWLAKFNSSGVFQWRRRLYKEGTGDAAGSSVAPLFYALTTDSSGNVYIAGNGYDTTGNYVCIALCKYNTSGALQWQRALYYASSNAPSATAIKVDSSGNVYILAVNHIIKYNSSGTLQWQKTIGRTGPQSLYGRSLIIDGSDNLYIFGDYSYYYSESKIVVLKMNSSGTILWEKFIYKSGVYSTFIATSGDIDSEGKLYVVGLRWEIIESVGTYTSSIAKFDSDGALIFQRDLQVNPVTQGGDPYIIVHSRLYVCFSLYTTPVAILALPKTGAGLGTYNELITYAEGTHTIAAGDSTTAAGSLTSATGVTNEGADSSLTLSDSSLTLDITAGPS